MPLTCSRRKFIAKFFRTNDRIQAQSLRVIDPEGLQLGVLSKAEALQKAQALGLDLIEIAANATPPVARILDFQKFRYDESKKERVAKRNAQAVELKEIWLSPRIAEHDLEVRTKKADEFLKKGNKVKFTVKFRGREMGHPEAGHKVLGQILSFFGERVMVDREAKFEGRNLTTIIGLAKGSPKKEETTDAKTENQAVTS